MAKVTAKRRYRNADGSPAVAKDKQLIQQATLFGDVVVTEKVITREELSRQLADCFTGVTASQLVSMLVSRFDAIVEYAALMKGEKAGQKISLLFNPHRLDIVAGASKRSLLAALQDSEFAYGFARAVLFKEGTTKEILYQTIQLGVNGVQYANEFPPHVARDICRAYSIPTDGSLLDPCAGWGGRMIGASTVVQKYVAYEPSTRTHRGLLGLIDFIHLVVPEFEATVHNVPYEDGELSQSAYDIALTSPPYFDTERYADEPTQSFLRYPTYEEWSKSFFAPLIERTMYQLKPGAPFILNIGNRKYPIARDMQEHFGDKFDIREISVARLARIGLGRVEAAGEAFYEVTRPQ